MLRADADALVQRLLAALPPTRAYVRADLAGPDVPRPVGHFLLQSLDRRLELEADAARRARSAWFGYVAPDVQAAEQAYWLSVGRYAQIPASEWARAVEQTVHQVVPYLVAPAQTLVHFVYADGADSLPVATIERRMRYFQPYPYLRDVVAEYARQKGLDAIARDDFSRLLARIEARTGSAYDADGLAALVEPLFETLGDGPEHRVTREHVVRFFSDKGLPDVVQRLSAAPEAVTLADVRAALSATPQVLLADGDGAGNDLRPSPADPAPPARPATSAADSAPVRPVPAVPPAPVAPTPVASDVPRWQQVRAAGAPSAAERLAPTNDAAPAWKRLLRGVDDDTVRLEQAVLGEGAAEHRKRFVKDLFGGDARAYHDALAHLAPLRTWDEAARAIAATFRAREIDLYDEVAVAFTDLAEQRYLG